MWLLLKAYDLLPKIVIESHLLWAMFFKVPPHKERLDVLQLHLEKGAVDLKTWKEHIWLVIFALLDLESAVASAYIDFVLSKSFFLHIFIPGYFCRDESKQKT